MTINKTAALLTLYLLLAPTASYTMYGDQQPPSNQAANAMTTDIEMGDPRYSTDSESNVNEKKVATKTSSTCSKITKGVFLCAIIAGCTVDGTNFVSAIANNTVFPSPTAIPTLEEKTYDCDIVQVNCTVQEDAEFEKMCQRFETMNATRAVERRRGASGAGHPVIRGGGASRGRGMPHRISYIPKDCTQACDIVDNKEECNDQALETGAVIVKDCNEPATLTNNGYAQLASAGVSAASRLVLGSMAFAAVYNFEANN